MEMLTGLIDGGAIALIAIAVIIAEVGVLILLKRGRRSLILANGFSGAFLLLALHAALTDGPATQVALWLGLGLVAHLADLWFRLR